jgi:hypothetical protein
MTAISFRKQRAFVGVPIIAAALLLVACGGATANPGGGANTPCVATLTGVTATNVCTSQAVGSGGAWEFTIGTTSNTTAGFAVDLSLDGTGTLATGTYTLGSSLTGSVGVTQASEVFQATYENAAGGNIPLIGTATLTITSFTSITGQASVLFPHGTLTASCPQTAGPDAGAAATAVVTITF